MFDTPFFFFVENIDKCEKKSRTTHGWNSNEHEHWTLIHRQSFVLDLCIYRFFFINKKSLFTFSVLFITCWIERNKFHIIPKKLGFCNIIARVIHNAKQQQLPILAAIHFVYIGLARERWCENWIFIILLRVLFITRASFVYTNSNNEASFFQSISCLWTEFGCWDCKWNQYGVNL